MLVKREAAIGVAASLAGLVAMAFDHLAHGADDWAAFAISVAVVLATAWLMFGVVVRRAHASPERAGRRSVICGVLAVLSLSLLWLGVTWGVAGGAIAVSLVARDAGQPRSAAAGLVLGALALVLSIVGTDWSAE
ncbi:MAG TPA: hypothetical protein VF423_04080 [Actinomycetes bacterium]